MLQQNFHFGRCGKKLTEVFGHQLVVSQVFSNSEKTYLFTSLHWTSNNLYIKHRPVVLNLFWTVTPSLAIYFWWHITITKCHDVCVLKWQICVFFYKMKSLDCLATHFDVTRDTQMCRDTLFEKHWHRQFYPKVEMILKKYC